MHSADETIADEARETRGRQDVERRSTLFQTIFRSIHEVKVRSPVTSCLDSFGCRAGASKHFDPFKVLSLQSMRQERFHMRKHVACMWPQAANLYLLPRL